MKFPGTALISIGCPRRALAAMRPRLLPGAIGSDARAIGAAMLPLHANFAPDRELFLKAG